MITDYCPSITRFPRPLPRTHNSLPNIQNSLLTTHYALLITPNSFHTTHYSFFIIQNSLFIIHHSHFTTHYLLKTDNSQLSTDHSLHILYNSPLITRHPLYELLITHNSRYNSQFTTHHSLLKTPDLIFTIHYTLSIMTTCFASRPFPSSSNMSISMWPGESQVFLLLVACVSFVSSLSCLISTTQTHATFIQHPSNQRVKKNLVTYISQNTASRSLFNTYCRVLTSHFSITHCSQLTTDNSQFITHNSLLITNSFSLPTKTTCFVSRPFTSSTNKSISMWPDGSQVFQLPVACVSFPHCSASPYSYNTPPINVWKKKTQLSTDPFCWLLNTHDLLFFIHRTITQYSWFIAHSYIFTATCSQRALTTYCLLLTAHHSQLLIYQSQLITHNEQSTTHHELQKTHNSLSTLLTIHNSQHTTYSSQRATHYSQIFWLPNH